MRLRLYDCWVLYRTSGSTSPLALAFCSGAAHNGLASRRRVDVSDLWDLEMQFKELEAPIFLALDETPRA